MYHFFVTADQVRENSIIIEGSDVNHMKSVLRLKKGEQISVSDGNNRVYLCEIEDYPEDKAALKILSETVGENELPAKLYLFQGIPKGDKLELIVQKSVELGAFRVIPVAMKRCVAKIEPKKEEAKLRRLSAISESAAKQSGRNIIPEVGPCMTLKEAVAFAKTLDRILLPYELAEDMEKTREIIGSVKPGESIGIFIGPEGGFDKEEAVLLQEAGAETITLGPRILRTETAPLAILSVLMFLLS